MSKRTLLIADADPRSLRILELALRKAGYAVETAADGAQALQRAPAVDLLICEATLPSKDGIDVCRELRAQPGLAALPIVIASADKALAARAIEAGADEFLRKPILLRELVHRVQVLLERRELSQADGAASLSGSVRDLGLVDALQSLLAAKKSAVVSCETYGRTARVWVRDGELVDAELGVLTGDAALARLLTWESGSFKAAPASIDREVRIDGGTEAALAEAMRQIEELGRVSDELAMTAIFAVDYDKLAEKLESLPDEVNGVLRSFDGRRALREAIDLSPVDDLSTMAIVRRLLGDGILRAHEAKPALAEKPSLQQWLSNPPPEQQGEPPQRAPGEVRARPIGIVRFPPLRGARRERLRREAEEARAHIAANQPVRLSRVVELPPNRSDAADALQGLRRMSPAVGEAAKKFAPDAPVARVNGFLEEAAPIAPVAPITPAPAVAPVVPETPAPAAIAPGTPPPDRAREAAMVQGLLPPKRPWRLYAAGAAVLLAGAWFARLQSTEGKRDAPRLGSVAAAHAERAAPALGVVHATQKERVAAKPPVPSIDEAAEMVGAVAPRKSDEQQRTAPIEPSTPASDRLYAKALEQGEAQLKLGRYRSAISHFQRAVKEKPQEVPALLALGDAFLEADKPGSAVSPLESAARLDGQSGRAQLLLGTAYQSLGRNADAVKAYQRYLDLDPQGEFARDVQLILAKLSR